MGDRCYVSLICREQDVPRFEALGFERDTWNDCASGVRMEGDEMNGAATDDLEELAQDGIPFTGSHGKGDEYGESVFASANGESIWMTEIGCGLPAVNVNPDGTIDPFELENARTYHRLNVEATHLMAIAKAERDTYLASLSEQED